MLLEHRVITRETRKAPTRVVWGSVAASAASLLMGTLTFAHLVPGNIGEGILWMIVGAGAYLYFLGWQYPLRYSLTDIHLRVARGFLNYRWVPLDRIDLICRISRDDELTYSGLTALADEGEPVIINPHRPPELRVAFTPSLEFLRTLFWATNRSGFDPLPPTSDSIDGQN